LTSGYQKNNNKKKRKANSLAFVNAFDSLKRSDSKEPCVRVSAQQQSCCNTVG